MEPRKPAAYANAPCPHRGGRQGASPQRTPARQPIQQQRPVQPAPVRQQPAPPPHPQIKRAYISAFAKGFSISAGAGERAVLPLEAQRSDGGMILAGGTASVPEDGYYMALWELGVTGAEGAAALHLGINEAASQLTYTLHPGYDSGQQVTWLNAGDRVSLLLQTQEGVEKAEVQCGSAQLTVIRLG